MRTWAIAVLLTGGLGYAGAFSGTSALEFTRKAVGLGPRPAGSPAIQQLQSYIVTQLKTCKCEVSDDAFTATTPRGAIAMKNIIAKFPGRSGRAIVITGHYDTKLFPGRRFVGANDGGSSTGLLLELARILAGQARTDDVYLVFLDGEEAVRPEWRDPDNRYGSRNLAARWKREGFLPKIKAMINVDMIGDRNLNLKREPGGNARLTSFVWNIAAELGYGRYFLNSSEEIVDDHLIFVQEGVPAIDLIDFDFPAWHEDDDTLDKLSAESLGIVGSVVEESIKRLERQ